MTNEIKEIYLSNLEWTKTYDNMGGVMGNVVFKDNISYEEFKKLFKSGYFILCDKDYITNLQEENERLKKQYAKEEKKLFHDNEILQTRIDKAIEYINNKKEHEYRNGNDNEFYLELNEKEMNNLLDILKGEDNNV